MFYDTWREHCDYEDNARYDYIREAYGDLGDSPETVEAEERWWAAQEAVATQDAMEARGGPLPRLVIDDEILF